jgi:hypothetical protein
MYAHVDLQLDVGSGISSSSSSRYMFCLCFLPSTLDPALCFRFKNEVFYSALFFSFSFLVPWQRAAQNTARLFCCPRSRLLACPTAWLCSLPLGILLHRPSAGARKTPLGTSTYIAVTVAETPWDCRAREAMAIFFLSACRQDAIGDGRASLGLSPAPVLYDKDFLSAPPGRDATASNSTVRPSRAGRW